MYAQLSRQALTPTVGSRQLVDLSSFVTSGSTGVLLYFENTNFGNAVIGACHPSQTTIRTQAIRNNTSTQAFVGINSSREVSIHRVSGVNVWLIGEFDSDAEFLTSDVDKTPGSAATWTSTSHSETTTAKFAIYNIVKAFDPDSGETGARHGDSTDDAQTTITNTNTWAIVPLNSSFETDLYVDAGYEFFLVGFIDSGADIVEPVVDKSTTTLDSFVTITPTTGTPEFMIVYYRGVNTSPLNGTICRLREPSASTNEFGRRPVGYHTCIVKCDGSGEIEQNIANLGSDHFIAGNITNAGAGPTGIPIFRRRIEGY